MPNEKRYYVRKNSSFKLTVKAIGKIEVAYTSEAQLLDIAGGGVSFKYNQPIYPGEEIELAIYVQVGQVDAHAIVLRCEHDNENGDYFIACEFTDMTEYDIEAIYMPN